MADMTKESSSTMIDFVAKKQDNRKRYVIPLPQLAPVVSDLDMKFDSATRQNINKANEANVWMSTVHIHTDIKACEMPITAIIDTSPTASTASKRVVSGTNPAKSRKPRQSTGAGGGGADKPLSPSTSINLPAGTSHLNDDMAEKASRRKSAHFGNIGVAPGDVPNPNPKANVTQQGPQGKRVVSALAVQAGKDGRRLQKRLSAVNPEMAGVSWEQRESKYEEWMKAAIDNKITSSNTWNFALIDYFHDMTLLRNGPNDQSDFISSPSARKRLTIRVDSVATETGKLLSGLAGGGNGEDVEEDGEGEGEDGDRPKAVRKTTTHRSESTLAKSFAALQVKKMDLEFSVDPLFKKTSADFDEGGAMGLLMNHLGVDGRGRVVFDAGDAVVEEEMDEEDEAAVGAGDMVDLSKLRQFISGPETVQNHVISSTLSSFRFSSDPSSMPDLTSLLGLKDTWDNDHADDDFSDFGGSAGPGGGGDGPVDFFGDEDFNVGGGGSGGGGGFDDGGSVIGDDDAVGMVSSGSRNGALGLGQPGENLMPFDPRRQGGGELVMALAGGGDGDGDGGMVMFDYFDKGFGARGWAGAEHWKLRKVAKKDPAAPTVARKSTDKDKSKPAFTIDFASPLPTASSSKVLFAPASRASITLAESSLASTSASTSTTSKSKASRSKRSSKNTQADDQVAEKKRLERLAQANLLPDDMHFSSRQLVRLFMKPKFALRMRRNTRSTRIENADGEIDENFWAEAAAERAETGQSGLGESSMPPPFESQFFADGDRDDATDAGDYAFVDDALDEQTPAPTGDTVEGEDDLWQGTQGQIKRARPENVNFAKRAKRVDVKRLKDDIWSGLRTLVPPSKSSESDTDNTDSDAAPAELQPQSETPIGEPKTFDGIITDLRRTYPREKMSEISTSFCFICLLHLANEEGLRIEAARFDGLEGEDVGCMGVADLDVPAAEMGAGKSRGKKGVMDGGEGEKVVGELQALRVYKDPTAGRAA